MDLRQYFRKIREIEATIAEPYTFITSLETSDGGKAGIITEVPRYLAAKMIVEGRGALTSDADRQEFVEKQKAAREAAIRVEAARRLQVTIVSESDAAQGARERSRSEHSPLKR